MKVDASRPQPFSPPAPTEPAPTLPLMHAVFVLAGLGTMLLGPILPLLAARWDLRDAQSGLLPLAQFCGATLGGVTVSSRLARDLLIGILCAGAGFLAFAFAPGFHFALPVLILGGFGVGRIIASVNILAGARYTANRGSAIARLNVSWSFGALLSPLLAAWLAPRVALPTLLASFAGFFLLCAAALMLQLRGAGAGDSASARNTPEPPLALPFFLYFAALLFLYGGLETSLSVWLTTYAIRFGQTSFVLSEYTLVLLLCGLTAGRALASWLLLKMGEATLLRIALVLAALLAAALAGARQAGPIATLAVLLGVALAPIFPATFALLMAHRPPARTAGIVLAASGLGAAALPSLIGVLSTHTGSLRIALAVPVAAALAMLLMSVVSPRKA